MSLIRLVLLLCPVLAIAGCEDKKYGLGEQPFGAEELRMIEQRTGLSLPSGSHGLNLLYQQNQIDPSFVAKVEIPASSHEAFAKQLEQIQDQEGKVIGSKTKEIPWWTPGQATIQVERHFFVQWNYVHVLLCKEGDRWVFYVEWIQN